MAAVHETVLEAMAAGREAGVTDKTIRDAPPRPAGAKLPSWLELYPETWPTHPGNPANNPPMVPWSHATHGKAKRGPSKEVKRLNELVASLEARLRAAPSVARARASVHDCEAAEARIRELESLLNIVRGIAAA